MFHKFSRAPLLGLAKSIYYSKDIVMYSLFTLTGKLNMALITSVWNISIKVEQTNSGDTEHFILETEISYAQ